MWPKYATAKMMHRFRGRHILPHSSLQLLVNGKPVLKNEPSNNKSWRNTSEHRYTSAINARPMYACMHVYIYLHAVRALPLCVCLLEGVHTYVCDPERRGKERESKTNFTCILLQTLKNFDNHFQSSWAVVHCFGVFGCTALRGESWALFCLMKLWSVCSLSAGTVLKTSYLKTPPAVWNVK